MTSTMASESAAGVASASADPATGTPGGILAPGEGRTVTALGAQATIKADGDALSFIEIREEPQGGPPLHLHRQRDEFLYVLEGDFTLTVGDRTSRAGPGTCAYIPRGVDHAYQNVGAEPGRILAALAPGRFAALYAEAAALSPGEPDLAKLGPLFERYDVHPK